MATVTGTMGGQPIDLDNAATETTLRALLQAVVASGLKNTEALKGMLGKAGLDVDAANAGLNNVGTATVGTKTKLEALTETTARTKSIFDAVTQTTSKLMSGTAEASDVLGQFAKIGGPIGMVFEGLTKIASIQEENMRTYQQISSAGVNFAGSLTAMRQSAADMHLTLGEFAVFMKTNSKTFAAMGDSATEGAAAFTKVSSSIVNSKLGKDLEALGLTSEQVNQGLASYISITGGRNKEELKSIDGQKKLAESAAAYMTQLDGLAQITGQNKEELEKALKAEMEEASFQAFMATKTKEEQDAIAKSMSSANALYGKAGTDIVMASAMGIAVQGEAGRKLTALSGESANAIQNDLAIRKKGGDQTAALNENEARGRAAAAANLLPLAGAVGTAGGALKGMDVAVRNVAAAQQAGIKGEEGFLAQRTKIAETQQKQAASEAAIMAESNIGMKKLGAALWEAFNPLISGLTWVVGLFGKMAGALAGLMTEFPGVSKVVIGVVTAMGALMLITQRKAIADAGKSVLGAVTGAAGGAAGGAGGAVGGIGKSAGSGMKGLASGLRAFANPQVLLGSTIFAASIAIIGAGIAGAAWMLGKTLPTLAEGLASLGEIDGMGLLKTAAGVGGLGLALVAFAPFAVFGIPASFALNMMADGVLKLNSVDPARLERVAAAMQKVKDATPSIGQSISAGISGLVSKVTGASESPAATGAETAATAPTAGGINMSTELQRLNTISTEMLKVMKEAADSMKRNVDATKALNRNLYA